jgi:hypothetical protein
MVRGTELDRTFVGEVCVVGSGVILGNSKASQSSDVGSIPIARSKINADAVAFTPPFYWKSPTKWESFGPQMDPTVGIGPQICALKDRASAFRRSFMA